MILALILLIIYAVISGVYILSLLDDKRTLREAANAHIHGRDAWERAWRKEHSVCFRRGDLLRSIAHSLPRKQSGIYDELWQEIQEEIEKELS